MMTRIIYSVLFLSMFAVQVFAQSYPEVRIQDIQYIHPDSLLVAPHDYVSKYEGDTVTVTGVLMNAPYFDANPDSGLTIRVGAAGFFLQDTAEAAYGGIVCRIPEGNSIVSILDTGDVVKVTGVVGEYYTTTQLNLIGFEPENYLGRIERPKPVKLTLDSLVQFGSADVGGNNYLMEKYEHVYVEIENVSATDPGAIGGGGFVMFDDNGSQVPVGNRSTFINTSSPPLAGTKFEYVRGFIESRNNLSNGWFIVMPVYENDLKLGDVIPPNVYDVDRDKGIVGLNEDVTVTAIASDQDGEVTSVKLFYRINDSDFFEVSMSEAGNDSTYSATIPGQSDSTLISYYVEATDNMDASSTNPSNPETNIYFYMTLGRDLTVQDVQYSPFGSGYSGYHGYEVTVSGVVTADTSDINGDGGSIGPKVYIQNGSGPWSGIWVFGTEALKLERGDNVTVTGRVLENYGVTRLQDVDDPSSIVNNGKADVPEAYAVGTDVIASLSGGQLPAESFESVLIKFENITVVDENADGDPGPGRNYGEMYVADGSAVQTRIELQDGNHGHHNFWDAAQENEPTRIYTGDTIESVTGLLYYSFGDFKLTPRKSDDIAGLVTSVKEIEAGPQKFNLSQNYPNPFNPSTTIEFSIASQDFVTLEVFNILGQKVITLVNEVKDRGIHQVQFDASDLTSGMYLYRLSVGQNLSVKKMLLIK